MLVFIEKYIKLFEIVCITSILEYNNIPKVQSIKTFTFDHYIIFVLSFFEYFCAKNAI